MMNCCRCDWPHWWVWMSSEALQSREQIITRSLKPCPENWHFTNRTEGLRLTSAFFLSSSVSASLYSISRPSSFPESSSEHSSSGKELLNSTTTQISKLTKTFTLIKIMWQNTMFWVCHTDLAGWAQWLFSDRHLPSSLSPPVQLTQIFVVQQSLSSSSSVKLCWRQGWTTLEKYSCQEDCAKRPTFSIMCPSQFVNSK